MTEIGGGGRDVNQDLRVPWEEDPADLYEHAPCGYLTTLPDGTIVKVNETFLAWTGYRRSDLIGQRRFRDLLSAGDKIYHETHYAPLLSMQNDVHEVAFELVRADGERLPILVNSVLGRDPAGLPRVIRTMVLNATERRAYEKELLAARRAAEASERRLRVLQQIVADLAAAPTEAEVADAVVRAPGPAFGAASATVWLADRDRLAVVAGTDSAAIVSDDIPRDSSRAVAAVARHGDLRVLGSLDEAEEHFPELAAAMRRTDRGTVVLLPLTAASADDPTAVGVLGVLGFDFAEQRRFTDSELQVVRLLGQQAGQALDRARLYDEARTREVQATFLAGTSRALETEPRLLPRAHKLIDRIVPEIAEWAAVRLQVGPAGLLADAGGPAPDPQRLADRVAQVLLDGEAQFCNDDDEDLDAGCAVLPLVANGRVFGTLALRLPAERRRAAGESGFLGALADRAGPALENARLYEQERAIARTLQRSLLAGDRPTDPRFAIETHYQAAAHDLEVGGDWFDAFLITPDKLAVVVGDVVGRGVEAAATMGQLRSAIRALASAEVGPARLLERLDRFVERVEPARMATVAYVEVDLSSNEIVYACAGHLPPLLAEPGGPAHYLLDARSGALGSRAGRQARTEHRTHMPAGSRLLLYTDGLIERRSRRIDAGFELLSRTYASKRDAPLPGLTAALADMLVGPEHPDDVCLLCLALGTQRRLERTIGADPVQIALLRKEMRAWLISHAVDDDSTQAVLLACSEAVANAIEHGCRADPLGQVDIVATVSSEAVDVRITDHGSWVTPVAGGNRGRGLQLIRRVMDQLAFDHSDGTTVTMRRIRREARR